jgi:hypothetical protein
MKAWVRKARSGEYRQQNMDGNMTDHRYSDTTIDMFDTIVRESGPRARAGRVLGGLATGVGVVYSGAREHTRNGILSGIESVGNRFTTAAHGVGELAARAYVLRQETTDRVYRTTIAANTALGARHERRRQGRAHRGIAAAASLATRASVRPATPHL